MKNLFIVALLATSFGSPFAHAEDKSKTKMMPKMEWSNLQRENMAKMHESMATCLRSNKSVSDCRAEMKTSCKEMGKDGCPMMHEKGEKGHRMMYDE